MPERDTTTWLLRESYRLISGAIQGSIPISDEPDAVHEGPEGEVHGAGGADRELAAGVTMQTLRSCSSALQPYAMLASMPNLGVYRYAPVRCLASNMPAPTSPLSHGPPTVAVAAGLCCER